MKLQIHLVRNKEIETYLHPPDRRARQSTAPPHAHAHAADAMRRAGRAMGKIRPAEGTTRVYPGAEWRGIARTSERTFLRGLADEEAWRHDLGARRGSWRRRLQV